MSKIQIHDGLCGTTMNVTTLPGLFTHKRESERERERAVIRKKTAISATRKDVLQAEPENPASSQHR